MSRVATAFKLVKDWANTQLALVIAYGVDLTGITILMYNMAPTDSTRWAFFAMGYLLVTVKLTAIRKRWLVAWGIAAIVNVFTTTSFFVTTSVPETTRPAPLYVVSSQEAFDTAQGEYTKFHDGKDEATAANRLTLLRDQYNPAATEAIGLKLESARTNLTEAKERALHEPVTGLEVFGRVPRLIAAQPEFAVFTLVGFWFFAGCFVELVLFYLKGGRFRRVKAEESKTDGAIGTSDLVVPVELTTSLVYPRSEGGDLVPPMNASRLLGVPFDVALALYSEEKERTGK